jgi:hypothetical protein
MGSRSPWRAGPCLVGSACPHGRADTRDGGSTRFRFRRLRLGLPMATRIAMSQGKRFPAPCSVRRAPTADGFSLRGRRMLVKPGLPGDQQGTFEAACGKRWPCASHGAWRPRDRLCVVAGARRRGRLSRERSDAGQGPCPLAPIPSGFRRDVFRICRVFRWGRSRLRDRDRTAPGDQPHRPRDRTPRRRPMPPAPRRSSTT